MWLWECKEKSNLITNYGTRKNHVTDWTSKNCGLNAGLHVEGLKKRNGRNTDLEQGNLWEVYRVAQYLFALSAW